MKIIPPNITPPLTKGTPVHISDGTPRPPAHHRKKLESWQFYNRDGFIHADEGEYVTIDFTGKGCAVWRLRRSMVTITPKTVTP